MALHLPFQLCQSIFREKQLHVGENVSKLIYQAKKEQNILKIGHEILKKGQKRLSIVITGHNFLRKLNYIKKERSKFRVNKLT